MYKIDSRKVVRKIFVYWVIFFLLTFIIILEVRSYGN